MILTFLLGLVNVYNLTYRSEEFSTAFFAFSLVLFFILFFVLESNRIYQFFRTANIRLLPVKTRRLYFYNLLYSTSIGIGFFLGNTIIGIVMNFSLLNIPFSLKEAWIVQVSAIVDIIVLFLVIQFLVCIYSATRQFVQKRFRWILEILLLAVFICLMNYLSAFDLGSVLETVAMLFGLKNELYVRVMLQLITGIVYFNLSVWVIDRYVEAGDQ
ncbi:hypothetical protein RV09_GL000675 [Enterococcus moraviensis]|nr:hypothetical protein RV09_GL000675 [Enterococcus moraviensis]